MRDKSFLNRNIRSTPLYLFDKVKVYSPFGELNSWILIILIVTSFTFIGKCLNKLKLDICICSSQDITIALCLVMTLALISFFCFFFTQHAITHISSRVSLYFIMIDQINELPDNGLKSSPETSQKYMVQSKNYNKLQGRIQDQSFMQMTKSYFLPMKCQQAKKRLRSGFIQSKSFCIFAC